MQIEYLDGCDEYLPLIRLFDFSAQEITQLRLVVDQLTCGGITEFDLDQLGSANVHDGIQFIFRLTDLDEGIKRTSPMNFELRRTQDGWEDLSWRLRSSGQDTDGHQWLLDVPSDIQLLLSQDGTW